jgi:long-chain fatty acid transport protein
VVRRCYWQELGTFEPRSGRAGYLVAVLVLLLPGAAWGDDTHYQDFVVGGRAMVLGGAFTSLADDSSGLYYNPAGIADAHYSSLQLSTSLYGFERGATENVLPVTGIEQLDIQFTDLIVIPASGGFVKTFGDKDPEGKPRQAYGLCVIVPSFRSSTASDGTDTATYQRRITDRELWTGVGYAHRLGERLRVGLSGFYILRSVVDVENLTDRESLGTNIDKFETVTNDISFLNGSVVFIGGAKYVLGHGLTLGLSVQSPSLEVHSQGDLRFSRATSDPTAASGATSRLERIDVPDASSDVRYAPMLRLGVNYVETYKYTLSADVSYHAPVEYELLKFSRDKVDPSRLPFNPKIDRRGVLNVNVGAEYLVVREVSVAAGLFTDFSTAPDVPAEPTVDQPPHVDLIGLTMSIGYFGKHSLSRIGVLYSFGSGYDVIPESNIDRVLGGAQDFKRADYFQSFFYVFLSSTFRY